VRGKRRKAFNTVHERLMWSNHYTSLALAAYVSRKELLEIVAL
jgi:hypothetical protein